MRGGRGWEGGGGGMGGERRPCWRAPSWTSRCAAAGRENAHPKHQPGRAGRWLPLLPPPLPAIAVTMAATQPRLTRYYHRCRRRRALSRRQGWRRRRPSLSYTAPLSPTAGGGGRPIGWPQMVRLRLHAHQGQLKGGKRARGMTRRAATVRTRRCQKMYVVCVKM